MAYPQKNELSGFNDGEPWSREIQRQFQITTLENKSMESEKEQDYYSVLQISRLILRLQMELMKETSIDPTTGKKKTLYGTETMQFKRMKERIKELQNRLVEAKNKSNDPSERYNRTKEVETLVDEIKDLMDDLMANNSQLGLNYKKNDVFEAWKE